MHVTAVTSLYRPHIGGVETMVEELAHELQASGDDVHVIAKQWPDTLEPSEVVDNIPITRVPSGSTNEQLIHAAQGFSGLHEQFTRTDIVHMVGMRRPLPLFGVLLGKLTDTPTVATVVGTEVPNPNAPASHQVWHEGSLYMPDAYRNASVVNAVSSETARLAMQVLPELTDTIDFLPVGIDLETYEQIEPVKLEGIETFIFSLRRLEHSKGIDVLVASFAQLKQTGQIGPDVHLVIAGDGPEKGTLQLQAQELGLDESSIHFIGSVNLERGIGLLKSAAMTVVPSRAEGGGLINTEANAVGCPLIASDVGGIREYTNQDSALLVEPDNPAELAQAIKELLDNPQLAHSLTTNGKQFAETRDWSQVLPLYYATYERAHSQHTRKITITSELTRRILLTLEGAL